MTLSTPAPMTPQTLARIRAMAPTCGPSKIADDIGWDVARVLRVARAHFIDLDPWAAAPVVNSDPVVALPKPRPAHLPALQQFDQHASLEDIMAALPNVHLRVLRMLYTVDDFVSCNRIAECSAISRETVARCMPQLARALEGTLFRIETKARRNGGFRLVKVES